jgi:excisionase family DNA binding protein
MFEEYADILSPGEAAEALRIGENALYELLNSGKLKAYKNGRNWLIPRDAVRQYVLEQARMK